MKKSPIILSVIVLWLASLACGGTSAVPTVDPNAAQTAIVETIAAIQAQTTPTALPTSTLVLPTTTEAPTLTAEPTGTPSVPTISVTVATNCRTGPGTEYERVGMLLEGASTEIVGRDAFGQYWYVRNPSFGVPYCWLSAKYAIISGNPFALPVQPIPGENGADFTADYRGQGKCSGEFWSDIRLTNASRGTFKSINILVTDQDTGDVHSYTGNEFTFRDGCTVRGTSTIGPDSGVTISAPSFAYNLDSHPMSATITLCTESNLTGMCATKIISYTP